MTYTLTQLLKTLVDQNGSDLHITSDSPPRIRVDGALIPLQVDKLTPDASKALCYSVLNPYQKEFFEKHKEVDLAFSVKNLARFRANVFLDRGAVAGAFRLIPQQIRTIDELKLPPIFKDICKLPKGLVLVTGPTGSGKSTTLAAMIDHINETRREHILTIEDPVEYVHHHKNCIVNQREVGEDTRGFAYALRSSLRQDPDVVLIGEMRDLETVAAAITTAETGHLVFATLHTNGCVQSLNRIIDIFPPHQQTQVRTQIAMSIQVIMSQSLVPAMSGGRELAMELMITTPAIRSLIAEGKFNQIHSYIQSGQAGSGMQTMNQALYYLTMKKRIAQKIAMEESSDPEELAKMFETGSLTQQYGGRRKLPGAS